MISIEDIRQAAQRLGNNRGLTPILEVQAINALTGGRVLFKAENLQRTGSFKFRGAFNKIASLDPEQRGKGVVTFSSGNHAQGVAAAAAHFGVPATVVMPADAPALKRANTARLGAELVLYDRASGDRKAIATEISARTGAVLVPPYDDAAIMAGQGTIGLEIAQQTEAMGVKPDLLLCPIGGGGLMAGVSVAMRALLPDTQIYCVEPEGFDDTRISLERGQRTANQPGASSICDAIVTDIPGELTFGVVKRNLDGGLAVNDHEVLQAVETLFEEAKLVVEPGGAVGLAALLAGKLPLEGRTAVVILSGGNMDLDAFRRGFGLSGQ